MQKCHRRLISHRISLYERGVLPNTISPVSTVTRYHKIHPGKVFFNPFRYKHNMIWVLSAQLSPNNDLQEAWLAD
jgi:hypothetical protein